MIPKAQVLCLTWMANRLLGYMWEAMASGAAIDEQRIVRQYEAKEIFVESPIPPHVESFDTEGMDPNDIIQPMPQSAPSSGRPQTEPSIAFHSEDEEDDDM